jgi:hypothetical protein
MTNFERLEIATPKNAISNSHLANDDFVMLALYYLREQNPPPLDSSSSCFQTSLENRNPIMDLHFRAKSSGWGDRGKLGSRKRSSSMFTDPSLVQEMRFTDKVKYTEVQQRVRATKSECYSSPPRLVKLAH